MSSKTDSNHTGSKDTCLKDTDSKAIDLYAVFSYQQLMLDTELVLNDQQLEILCDAKKCRELLGAHPDPQVYEIVQPLLRLYEQIGKENRHQEKDYLTYRIRQHIGILRVKRTCSRCGDINNDRVYNHCIRRDILLCRNCELNSMIRVEL